MREVSAPRTIKALFGGAFDPPHYGHLLPLQETADITGLPHISLLPANVPVFKKGITPAKHRIAMTQLLCKQDPRFDVDLTEFSRNEVSYTIDTLMQIRQLAPNQSLIFIIGLDSLLTLHLWERYQTLFTYCHILVMLRPSAESVQNIDIKVRTNSKAEDSPHGAAKLTSNLYNFHTSPQAFEDIVGEQMKQSHKKFLLSKLAVAENDAQCINRDAFKDIIGKSSTGNLWFINNKLLPMSSTNIRQRVIAGKTISHCVPSTISDYIVKHQLYKK